MADARSYTEEDLSRKFKSKFEEARREIKKPNILLLGGTGVGKSSLVNLVFGKDVAAAGAGRPVTVGVKKYEHDLVVIYDSAGYETGEENQRRYNDDIVSFIDRQRDASQQIHLVWYCVSQAAHRFTDLDAELVNKVAGKRRKLAIILTQADAVSEEESAELKVCIEGKCPGVQIFETSVDPSIGLSVEPLVDWSVENLDESLHEAFISAAKNALPFKRKLAHTVVQRYAVGAAAIGATPIPFSDAPLLVAAQVGMIAHISSIYDLPKLQCVTAGGLLGDALTQVGRSAIGSLLKFIPGVGSVLGGVINAAVASSLTAATGYAFTEVCHRIATQELEGNSVDIPRFFQDFDFADLVKKHFDGRAK